MTVKELSELHYLEGLIAHEQERLQDMRDKADVKAQIITGMPHGSGAKDRIGEIVPKIADAERELMDGIREYTEKRERILRYINRVPNARMKMILMLRFVDQKKWQEVADIIGGKETEYSVKSACYRYVEGRDEPPAMIQGQVSFFD